MLSSAAKTREPLGAHCYSQIVCPGRGPCRVIKRLSAVRSKSRSPGLGRAILAAAKMHPDAKGRRMVRVVLVTESIESNSLGRTHALWTIARSLGADVSIVSPRGEQVWSPLRGSEFAEHLTVFSQGHVPRVVREANVIVGCKPLPWSLGIAHQWAADLGTPLVADVDDADLEAGGAGQSPVERMMRTAGIPPWIRREPRKLARILRATSVITSNPTLQKRWGGEVIPHVREPGPSGADHTSWEPTVSFVGTMRRHKGADVLRRAVANLRDINARLIVTDSPPDDAKPWESWIGATNIDDGMKVVASSDIAAIPSLETRFSRAQLPAKLMDAMVTGRAVVASDLPPIEWALAGSGRLVAPGSASHLEAAIRHFADPAVRAEAGIAARQRALDRFTVSANEARFTKAIESASIPEI